MIERFLEVGFSKFVVRPMAPPEEWRPSSSGWPAPSATSRPDPALRCRMPERP